MCFILEHRPSLLTLLWQWNAFCFVNGQILSSSPRTSHHIIMLRQLCRCHRVVVSFGKGSRVTACLYVRILRVLFGWYANSWIKVWAHTVLEPVFCAQERCALLSNLFILLKIRKTLLSSPYIGKNLLISVVGLSHQSQTECFQRLLLCFSHMVLVRDMELRLKTVTISGNEIQFFIFLVFVKYFLVS